MGFWFDVVMEFASTHHTSPQYPIPSPAADLLGITRKTLYNKLI
jgi:DNA-binding protein Fis